MYNHFVTDRHEFFNKSLERLRESSTSGCVDYFKQQCMKEQALYDEEWKSHLYVPTHSSSYGSSLITDPYAQSLLPPPLERIYNPVQCIGDGNCLYRYISIHYK